MKFGPTIGEHKEDQDKNDFEGSAMSGVRSRRAHVGTGQAIRACATPDGPRATRAPEPSACGSKWAVPGLRAAPRRSVMMVETMGVDAGWIQSRGGAAAAAAAAAEDGSQARCHYGV